MSTVRYGCHMSDNLVGTARSSVARTGSAEIVGHIVQDVQSDAFAELHQPPTDWGLFVLFLAIGLLPPEATRFSAVLKQKA